MDRPIRLNVAPRGNGFVAQSSAPKITALGASVREAVDNAQTLAKCVLADGDCPNMMLVCIDLRGTSTIVMQPFGESLRWERPMIGPGAGRAVR